MALCTDQVLVAKVKTQIAVSGLKDKGDIKVEAKDGIITLTGRVDSEKTVRAARQACISVPEVMGINNLLKVKK